MNWIFVSEIINSLGWTLVHSIWQIAALSMLLWLAFRLIDPRRSDLRYVAAASILTLSFLIPVLTLVRMVGSAERSIATGDAGGLIDNETRENGDGPAERESYLNQLRPGIQTNAAWVSSETVSGANQIVERYLRGLFPYFVSVWLAGIILFSMRISGGIWQLNKYRRHRLSKVPEEWARRFETICVRIGASKVVELLSSKTLSTPIAVGVFRPVIIVPAAMFLQIEPRQLEAIIVHELIHIRRHDPLVNVIQIAIETVFFYHPGIWWISRQVRREREFAADAAVLEIFEDGNLTYAAALASLEEVRLSADRTVPSIAAAANGGSLMQRIQRILNEKTEKRNAGSAWSAGAAIVLISAVLLTVFLFIPSSGVNAEHKDKERKLAVGFVSIPPLDRSSDPPKDADATARLVIAKLQQYKIPAIGFVNGGQISDGEKLFPVRANIVRLWRDAGLEIGIGSFKHIWFYNTAYPDYVAAVEKNESITRKLLAEKNLPLRYFSYPYLNTGRNAEDRDRFEQWLNARGIRSVKYTIDNQEWMYSYAYDKARMDNDLNTMSEIRQDFIHYMEKMFDHYEAYSREAFGRDIAQTMVLTPSRLVADSADELFQMIKKRGYRFVSMDEALSDDAYNTPENMFGDFGNSWFERWAYTQGKKLREEPAVDAEVFAAWKQRDAKNK